MDRKAQQAYSKYDLVAHAYVTVTNLSDGSGSRHDFQKWFHDVMFAEEGWVVDSLLEDGCTQPQVDAVLWTRRALHALRTRTAERTVENGVYNRARSLFLDQAQDDEQSYRRARRLAEGERHLRRERNGESKEY